MLAGSSNIGPDRAMGRPGSSSPSRSTGRMCAAQGRIGKAIRSGKNGCCVRVRIVACENSTAGGDCAGEREAGVPDAEATRLCSEEGVTGRETERVCCGRFTSESAGAASARSVAAGEAGVETVPNGERTSDQSSLRIALELIIAPIPSERPRKKACVPLRLAPSRLLSPSRVLRTAAQIHISRPGLSPAIPARSAIAPTF